MKILLFLHILGAILFLGNIMTAFFWKFLADRERDLQQIHQMTKGILLTDYVFTLPSIALILIPGFAMGHMVGIPFMEINWLTVSLLLFLLTSVIGIVILTPAQKRMVQSSKDSIEQGRLTEAYRQASKTWIIFGIIAFILPMIVLFLMVYKGF